MRLFETWEALGVFTFTSSGQSCIFRVASRGHGSTLYFCFSGSAFWKCAQIPKALLLSLSSTFFNFQYKSNHSNDFAYNNSPAVEWGATGTYSICRALWLIERYDGHWAIAVQLGLSTSYLTQYITLKWNVHSWDLFASAVTVTIPAKWNIWTAVCKLVSALLDTVIKVTRGPPCDFEADSHTNSHRSSSQSNCKPGLFQLTMLPFWTTVTTCLMRNSKTGKK